MDKNLALETLRSFVDNTDNKITKDAILTLVPELCESEDERIRKKCIELIKRVIPSGNNHSQESKEILDCIAYLEKQKAKERLDRMAPIYNDKESFESALEKAWKYYNESASRTVDSFEDNYIECVFSKGFREGFLYKEKQKEQKPILEVFGFKIGDAVRLKDGDGRKHIIKSFEEVEGVHGPNFYHVEFEDDSARDGIYPGEEYPNGYFTQMEKFEEEQKPAEWSYPYGRNETADRLVSIAECLEMDGNCLFNGYSGTECGNFLRELARKQVECKLVKWSENDKEMFTKTEQIVLKHWNSISDSFYDKYDDENQDAESCYNWFKSLPERFNLQPKQEWSEEDEKMLRTIISDGSRGVQLDSKQISFLESLRPRPHTVSIKYATKFANLEYERGVNDGIQSEKSRQWKPNEEQILALRYYLNNVPYSLHKEHLSSLRDECEKLFK